MFINKDSIMINNVSMGQYLTQAKYEFNKLWASDTGRNLAGTMTGTLIGIYPKLVLSFRRLSQGELNVVAPILDSDTQSVTYYDPTKNQSVTISTYTGDWNIVNKYISSNEGFECSFIAREKRA